MLERFNEFAKKGQRAQEAVSESLEKAKEIVSDEAELAAERAMVHALRSAVSALDKAAEVVRQESRRKITVTVSVGVGPVEIALSCESVESEERL